MDRANKSKVTDQQSVDETFSVLPTGESCDKCGSTKTVQKFDGSYLCNGCQNQYLAMR